MKKIFFISSLISMIFVLQGCENDDLPNPGGNKEVESTFKSMYSGVTRVEWEKKGNYWVVDFWKESKEMEAWFETNGNWYQTETDISFAELPETIKNSFQSGEYKDWRIDDVDMFEQKDSEPFYILDVEKGNQDYDLHYSIDGTLIKAVPDNS